MLENENTIKTKKGNGVGNGISREQLEQSVQNIIQILAEPDRAYKDHVFRMLLKDRKVALEVYNAMNDTSYDNPDELIITTLENAIYMGMKNDVSFIIGSQLVLYEHQSTVNLNMPLRNLFYVSCVYSALTMNENIYGEKLIRIPEPKFVVFYNGLKKLPEKQLLKLSDAYEKKSEDISMELTIEVVNINPGYNNDLMKKSPTLQQYMHFIDITRKYQKTLPFKSAIEKAIDECIDAGILKEFLKKNRAEVLRMSIFEYDQEKHMQQERDASREAGREEGQFLKLINLVIKKINKGNTPEQTADMLEEDIWVIKNIYDAAESMAPDYDAEKIMKAIVKK